MRIKIELENNLEDEEIIIKCSKVDKKILDIEQAISNVIQSEVKLSFLKEGKEYYLPLEDILFFETNDINIYAHTADDTYNVKYRLYELEEILPHNFMRVSKSTILNLEQIYSIERNLTSSSLIQFHKSHKQVYVSRYYYKELRERLRRKKKFMIKKGMINYEK